MESEKCKCRNDRNCILMVTINHFLFYSSFWWLLNRKYYLFNGSPPKSLDHCTLAMNASLQSAFSQTFFVKCPPSSGSFNGNFNYHSVYKRFLHFRAYSYRFSIRYEGGPQSADSIRDALLRKPHNIPMIPLYCLVSTVLCSSFACQFQRMNHEIQGVVRSTEPASIDEE